VIIVLIPACPVFTQYCVLGFNFCATGSNYSILMDSTPDGSHVDPLSLIFGYVENATPVERFVIFMPNQGHKTHSSWNKIT
jgi:hypothetical protein